MKKLISGGLMASILSGLVMILLTRSVNAQTEITNVTMIIHEDKSDNEQTTMGGRTVALYDITSIYLEAKQATDFDEKKFSETWSDNYKLTDVTGPVEVGGKLTQTDPSGFTIAFNLNNNLNDATSQATAAALAPYAGQTLRVYYTITINRMRCVKNI